MGAYEYADVPVRPDGSRFAVTTSKTGQRVRAPQNVVLAYAELLRELTANVTPFDRRKTVELKKVARTTDDAYAVVRAGTVTAEADAEPIKSGKFTKRGDGGAWLDTVFLGDNIAHGRDEDIYDAARELAEAESFSGSDLRKLNEALAGLVLLRAGIVGFPHWNLPI